LLHRFVRSAKPKTFAAGAASACRAELEPI